MPNDPCSIPVSTSGTIGTRTNVKKSTMSSSFVSVELRKVALHVGCARRARRRSRRLRLRQSHQNAVATSCAKIACSGRTPPPHRSRWQKWTAQQAARRRIEDALGHGTILTMLPLVGTATTRGSAVEQGRKHLLTGLGSDSASPNEAGRDLPMRSRRVDPQQRAGARLRHEDVARRVGGDAASPAMPVATSAGGLPSRMPRMRPPVGSVVRICPPRIASPRVDVHSASVRVAPSASTRTMRPAPVSATIHAAIRKGEDARGRSKPPRDFLAPCVRPDPHGEPLGLGTVIHAKPARSERDGEGRRNGIDRRGGEHRRGAAARRIETPSLTIRSSPACAIPRGSARPPSRRTRDVVGQGLRRSARRSRSSRPTADSPQAENRRVPATGGRPRRSRSRRSCWIAPVAASSTTSAPSGRVRRRLESAGPSRRSSSWRRRRRSEPPSRRRGQDDQRPVCIGDHFSRGSRAGRNRTWRSVAGRVGARRPCRPRNRAPRRVRRRRPRFRRRPEVRARSSPQPPSPARRRQTSPDVVAVVEVPVRREGHAVGVPRRAGRDGLESAARVDAQQPVVERLGHDQLTVTARRRSRHAAASRAEGLPASRATARSGRRRMLAVALRSDGERHAPPSRPADAADRTRGQRERERRRSGDRAGSHTSRSRGGCVVRGAASSAILRSIHR